MKKLFVYVFYDDCFIFFLVNVFGGGGGNVLQGFFGYNTIVSWVVLSQALSSASIACQPLGVDS